MKKLTEKEKQIIDRLGDGLYTSEFCDEWMSRKTENVFTNAPAALQQVMVDGFVHAVQAFMRYDGNIEELLGQRGE